MTAKQYLQQAFGLNKNINTALSEISRLRALAMSITGVSDGVVSSGISDHVGNLAVKIADAETALNAEVDFYVDLQREIREKIESMPDNNLRLVLRKRYVDFKKWEQIAVDMEASFQWAHKLHRRALREFEKMYFS